MKLRLFLWVAIIITLALSLTPSMGGTSFGDPLASLVGENGLTIVSYSVNWKSEEKLRSVYEELLKNAHGSEMAFLSTIYIYPGGPTDYPAGFTSFYHEDVSQAKDGKFIFHNNCTIEIYNADEYTELSQMARILSHEYGHHFTFYYLMTKENLSKDEWIVSQYADLRNLQDYSQVTYLNENPKTYSHEWDIAEILADDYVQLFGSELAKKSRDYMDVKERIDHNLANYYFHYSDFNLLPQENLKLELASDVEGLANYFESLSGVQLLKQPERIAIK
ncbi:MAG: hypothetical protein H7X94_01250, partial [Vallitaleaceae bacterium]|nr:hypothetical protein [Vallitaleaceae bacterium]